MGEVDNRVGHFRRKRSLTQEQLAQSVGVSRQTINAIERGRFDPSLPLAIRLARTFDVEILDLFTLKTDQE
ncbi:helix-turn-helix transcriptional regulator [Ornithinimicrobium ciconiae]|uniref:Helix-turn-helix transcriptional regulator n=1 Tax=Ornithinimicrobium ciconiae TaxID=2594265 RepID=A0A516GEM6_9MICO|nr:helix-turn-helix transcriptional regulator [Ornithinimicrobium ciconiae]QDO89948.1 helix-turn-helix transcriptional regulator [Ornithinimicrobium ciconiae]